VKLKAGGKTDTLHGAPVSVSGRVRSLHEGTYEDWLVRHGGQQRYNQGVTAVVEVDTTADHAEPETGLAPHSYLVLTTLREPPFSLQQIASLGINPERQQILVVKAAIAYRAAYEPIAGRIIEVDTPGLTCINPASFTYKRARRPLWGVGN
jgi:microcystin degradation protein MlrC